MSYRFGTTWGWVNDDRIFIFWVNYPFSVQNNRIDVIVVKRKNKDQSSAEFLLPPGLTAIIPARMSFSQYRWLAIVINYSAGAALIMLSQMWHKQDASDQ